MFVSIDGKRELRVKRITRLATTAVAILLVLFVVSIVGAASEGTTSPPGDSGTLLRLGVPPTAVSAAADRV